MTSEDRLRTALRAAAGPVRPDPTGADRLLATAAHRRRRRATALSALAVAAVLAVGSTALLADDEASEVRTGPATRPTPTTTAPRVPVPPSTAVALTDKGAVVVVDATTGAVVRTLAPAGSATRGRLSRSDDGWVYYARFVPCGVAGDLYRVPADGTGPPERIAAGASPSISPDGRRLAYAARWSSDARDPGAACHSTIVVRDLATGTEKQFPPTADTNAFIAYGHISAVDWAPDGRRLAFQMGWEGEGSYVLDTVAHATTRDAEPLGSDLTANGMMAPAWHPNGRIAAVSDCCYELEGPKTDTPQPTLLIDPATKASSELLDGSVVPTSLDFDATGRFLLYVDKDGVLFVREEGGSPRRLAPGFHAAAW